MKYTLEKIKPLIIETLKRYDVIRASIFGSLARGEAINKSDAMVCYECKAPVSPRMLVENSNQMINNKMQEQIGELSNQLNEMREMQQKSNKINFWIKIFYRRHIFKPLRSVSSKMSPRFC